MCSLFMHTIFMTIFPVQYSSASCNIDFCSSLFLTCAFSQDMAKLCFDTILPCLSSVKLHQPPPLYYVLSTPQGCAMGAAFCHATRAKTGDTKSGDTKADTLSR